MAWPDWTKSVRFCMLGPGETPGEYPGVTGASYIQVAHLVRHVAFLLSLPHLSHYKGALNVSKHLISMCQRGCVVKMMAVHPCPLTAFLGSSLPVVPP